MQLGDVHFASSPSKYLEMTLDSDDAFVERLHAGDRETLARCYREHHAAVLAAAARVLPPVDAETVAHEVWNRLLANESMRASFKGGDLRAWLTRVTRNQAIDHRRRYDREAPLPDTMAEPPPADTDGGLVASLVVERFRKERLPPKWEKVFETRFLEQLGQREAAAKLGMHRTTLMYQEHRIRALLRKFVLEES
jgi:RNA polymerase sigma-70 factor (ECF subfamily)